MRRIGNWIESIDDERFVPPQECVGELPSDVIERVVSYLDAGTTFETYRGHSWCRFGCGVEPECMGSREFTDGNWVWPEGLGHYVSRHKVMLPEEFIKAALLNAKEKEAFSSQDEVDDQYWIDWCRNRVSSSYLQRIDLARKAAEHRSSISVISYLRQIELEKGISNEPCMTKNCTNHALVGVVFCSACWVKLGAFDPGRDDKFSALIEFLESY